MATILLLKWEAQVLPVMKIYSYVVCVTCSSNGIGRSCRVHTTSVSWSPGCDQERSSSVSIQLGRGLRGSGSDEGDRLELWYPVTTYVPNRAGKWYCSAGVCKVDCTLWWMISLSCDRLYSLVDISLSCDQETRHSQSAFPSLMNSVYDCVLMNFAWYQKPKIQL